MCTAPSSVAMETPIVVKMSWGVSTAELFEDFLMKGFLNNLFGSFGELNMLLVLGLINLEEEWKLIGREQRHCLGLRTEDSEFASTAALGLWHPVLDQNDFLGGAEQLWLLELELELFAQSLWKPEQQCLHLEGAPELKSLLMGAKQKVQKLCNIKLRPRQIEFKGQEVPRWHVMTWQKVEQEWGKMVCTSVILTAIRAIQPICAGMQETEHPCQSASVHGVVRERQRELELQNLPEMGCVSWRQLSSCYSCPGGDFGAAEEFGMSSVLSTLGAPPELCDTGCQCLYLPCSAMKESGDGDWSGSWGFLQQHVADGPCLSPPGTCHLLQVAQDRRLGNQWIYLGADQYLGKANNGSCCPNWPEWCQQELDSTFVNLKGEAMR
ncbi:hypothetical protein IHE44_0004472 [Lamprotornis superbus]|uniref:Uncharacterized protein n=1 Tax=Lamprotornis superbus TaxID=245042 RepID=A0A835TUB5_9PASS|nr:hypothetical protein IHE44_0004472 [Lamprotornis superbus]